MANDTIINSTASKLTNVNAGGTDVPTYTIQTGVTLTDAELATLTEKQGDLAAGVLSGGTQSGKRTS